MFRPHVAYIGFSFDGLTLSFGTSINYCRTIFVLDAKVYYQWAKDFLASGKP